MKIKIDFKTPDVVYNVLSNYKGSDINPEEISDTLSKFSKKYLLFGEILTVEYDTESENITVIPVK